MTVHIDECYGIQLNENQINLGYRNIVDVLRADITKLTKENFELRETIRIYDEQNQKTISDWKI